MTKHGFYRSSLIGLSFVALAACGDDASNPGGSGTDRGGPEALSGFTWSSKQSAQGIDFDFSVEFGTATIVASNTCTLGGDSLTAEVEVPAKYRYRATITNGAEAGDEACHVAVTTGTIDFEINGNTLTGTSNGQTLTFTSTGARSGLYGDWSYTSDDGFTLTWSMGNGKLNASGTCPGSSATPKVTVAATYENFVEITQGDETMVGDESFNCSIGIEAGSMQYRFDGATLVLTYGGQDLRLAPE